MPALLTPIVRDRLPTRPVRINRQDPISKGLVFAAYPVGTAFYDAVSGLVSSKTGQIKVMPSSDGNRAPAKHGQGASGTGGLFPARTGADRLAGVHTAFVEASLTANTTATMAFRSNDTGTGDGFGMSLDDINLVTNGFYYYANNGDRGASNWDVLGANSEQYSHRIAITNDGINTRFYAKGKLDRTVAETTLPNANSGRRMSIAGSIGSQGTQSTALVLIWDRVIGVREYQRLYNNPAIVFEPDDLPLFWTTVTAQFLRPISDVSNYGWTPSSGSDLFPMIGEATRNDATYISAIEAGAACEVLLGTSTGDPLSSINHLPRIVMSAGSGGIIVRLKQGATLIKEWTYSSLAGSDTLYEPTLTGGEIDSITDYTDLRLYLETTA